MWSERGQKMGSSGKAMSQWLRGMQSGHLTSLFPLPPLQDLLREEGEEETKSDVPRIQCGDGCDPQGLKDNSQVPLSRCWCAWEKGGGRKLAMTV